MNYFAIIAFMILSFHSFSEEVDCVPGVNCQSQLLRLNINSQAIEETVGSPDFVDDTLIPALASGVSRPDVMQMFIRDYPIDGALGFPHNAVLCEQEKSQGDPNFQNVDCNNPLFCSDPEVPREAKMEACTKFPCTFLVEDLASCQPSDAMAMPTLMHYEPIGLKDVNFSPIEGTSSRDGNRISTCFRIDRLQIETGVQIEFEPSGNVTYDRVGLTNINVQLDGPRDVCASFELDLTSNNLFKDFRLERRNGAQFVSNDMINQTIGNAEVIGLEGYSEDALSTLQTMVLPSLLRHFRPTIESAIEGVVSQTTELFVQETLAPYRSEAGSTFRVDTSYNTFMSELGVSNMMVGKYVDLLECAILKEENRPIPSDSPCFGEEVYPFGGDSLSYREIPSVNRAARRLEDQFETYDHITSESIRSRIEELRDRMIALGRGRTFERRILPGFNQISQAQTQMGLENGVNIIARLGESEVEPSLSVAAPDICDELNPSAHSTRSLENCPVEAYVDLDEVNRLFDNMFESGRLCHQGRGEFQLGDPPTRRGRPNATGCLLRMEEKDNGMSCFLDGAPHIVFNAETGGYKIVLNTKGCYRGAEILGQGRIGGDLNFEISYTPGICDGELCLTDGASDWNVTPGTERYALRDRSLLSGMVRRTINKQLRELLPEQVNMPGLPGASPIEFEGRLDMGPGYFGACLQTKS